MEQLQNLDKLATELRGKLLYLKRKSDLQIKQIDQQAKTIAKTLEDIERDINEIRNEIPTYALSRERDFKELKMKYRGHTIMPNGKVRLKQRETA